MTLNELLPLGALPEAENHTSTDRKWSFGDSPDSFQRNGGHALYHENSISYDLNSLRYRCPAFTDTAKVRLLSIGCSYTYGVGLPQTALYHERFAERLRNELGTSVVNWNLGCGAVSNNYIARLLHLAVPLLKPDIVLIFFTHLARREYLTADNRSMKYLPNTVNNFTNAVFKRLAQHLLALTSKYDDQLSFFRDYKSIEALLGERLWSFSMIHAREIAEIEPHLSPVHRAGDYTRLDVARDNLHLGPESHRTLYEAFWRSFEAQNGLEKLREASGIERHAERPNASLAC